MRKLIAIVSLTAALMLSITSAASAQHPSENRALQGFGGDPDFPHCHINLNSGQFAFPSHRAHIASGLMDGVFMASTTCPPAGTVDPLP